MKSDEKGPVPASSQETHGELREIKLGALWSRRSLLIVPVVLSMGLGALYVSQAQPLYEAEARILIESGVQLPGDALVQDRRPRDERLHMATQAEVLRSPALVSEAVHRLRLPAGVATREEAEALAMRGLEVAPLGEAHVLRLRFSSHDPEWTPRFLTALIDTYADDLSAGEQKRYGEMSRLLSRRESLLDAELAAARAEYAAARQDTPLVGQGADAARLQFEALRSIKEQLSTVRSRRVDLESRLQAAAQRQGGSGVAAVPAVQPGLASAQFVVEASAEEVLGGEQAPVSAADSRSAMKPALVPAPVPPAPTADLAMSDPARIQQELSRARAEADRMAQRYGSKHPELKSARAEVDFWQTRLEHALAESIAASRMEVDALRLSERQLEADYGQAADAVRRLGAHLLIEQQHLDRIQQLEELHLATRAQAVEAEALASGTEAAEHAGIRVLEAPPAEEVTAVWPKPLHVLGACGALSLVGGLVLIGYTEQRRTARVVG